MDTMVHNRAGKFFAIAGKSGAAALVLVNGEAPNLDPTFFYFTGLRSGLFEGCYAVLFPDGKVDLVVSTLEEQSARESGLNLRVFRSSDERGRLLDEALRGVGVIGINSAGLLTSDYLYLHERFKDRKLVDLSKYIETCRGVKDANEIEQLRKSADIASNAFYDIRGLIKEGKKETELAADINYLLLKGGASSTSFDTICAFGKNSAEPHYSPSAGALRREEIVLCDYGAIYNRYCSDITRTFVFRSDSDKYKDMYSTVFEAQKAAFGMIRVGAKGSDVHNAALRVIDGKYNGRFIHGLGHSIGVAVHDGLRMGPGSDLVLEKNMVLTVEPGVYIPGYGGVRIEDDIVVKEEGFELLTKAPKEWAEINIQ
jgi:Xaa-Pro dipeptidase